MCDANVVLGGVVVSAKTLPLFNRFHRQTLIGSW